MAHFRSKHPWDPGYALPGSVLAEPPGNRGSIHTHPAPRKTIQGNTYIPAAWKGGYVLPKYVKAEPWGRGAAHRHWAPRKTIQQTVPEPLQGIVDIIKKPAEWIGKGASKVAGAGKKVTCKIVSKDEAALAAGAAGAAFGTPATGAGIHAGVQLVGGMCRAADGRQGYFVPEPPRPQIPWVPIAVGGGLLALILITRK